jgi:hypothetical protein
MTPEFKPFPKMARLSREIIVTEKIDGTNAQIFISETTPEEQGPVSWEQQGIIAIIDSLTIRAGSRTRWITPGNDNFGFAAWVNQNRDELIKLGPGQHFGEWWGQGIQRKYGLDEKRFSLFNTIRWCLHGQEPQRIVTADPRIEKYQEALPKCCHLVPVLYQGPFDTAKVDACLWKLYVAGSMAAPGFMKPEGIVLFHVAGNVGFKKTIKKDEIPKALANKQSK